jgi:hypothetical protein
MSTSSTFRGRLPEPVNEIELERWYQGRQTRLPLQLDLDQLPELAARDDRASWTVTMTTRSSSSK